MLATARCFASRVNPGAHTLVFRFHVNNMCRSSTDQNECPEVEGRNHDDGTSSLVLHMFSSTTHFGKFCSEVIYTHWANRPGKLCSQGIVQHSLPMLQISRTLTTFRKYLLEQPVRRHVSFTDISRHPMLV